MSLSFINCNSQEEIKSISTQELKTLLEKEKVQLMDVRSPEEVEEGFIKTAVFMNFYDTDFVEKATKKLDKSKTVYLYCRSGGRSMKSAKMLKEKGYSVVNILGGYIQWKKEN